MDPRSGGSYRISINGVTAVPEEEKQRLVALIKDMLSRVEYSDGAEISKEKHKNNENDALFSKDAATMELFQG